MTHVLKIYVHIMKLWMKERAKLDEDNTYQSFQFNVVVVGNDLADSTPANRIVHDGNLNKELIY